MVKRPFLALCIILCGLLMVAAGLGYTVNEASHYTGNGDTLKAGAEESDSGEPGFLPKNNGIDLPFHPRVGDAEDVPPGGKAAQRGVQHTDTRSTSFFFPALSLLSGAVLAATGAIALLHRWHGIGMH